VVEFLAGTFVGIIVGAAILTLFALWLAARPKNEAKPQHGVSAIGLDPTGKAVSIDPHTAYQLREVFKHLDNGAA
jgi:hypothetical protein